MLKPAYLNTTNQEINKLISEGNYIYARYSTYDSYSQVDLLDDQWRKIQSVSIDEYGNILGYFNASIDRSQRSIDNTLFIKLRYKFMDYAKEIMKKDSSLTVEDRINEMKKQVDKDFNQFVDDIINHPMLNRVFVNSFVENPANKTYEKWIDKYNGVRYEFKNNVLLKDGKLHDTYTYYFDRS